MNQSRHMYTPAMAGYKDEASIMPLFEEFVQAEARHVFACSAAILVIFDIRDIQRQVFRSVRTMIPAHLNFWTGKKSVSKTYHAVWVQPFLSRNCLSSALRMECIMRGETAADKAQLEKWLLGRCRRK